ncbi:MAG: hypothetical protein ACI9BV_003914 [Rhodothermales bacterium]
MKLPNWIPFIADRGTNPDKTRSMRDLGAVEIGRLSEAVGNLSESSWSDADSDKPNQFSVLGKTQHMVFRFILDFQTHRNHADTPLWAEWKELIQPILDETARRLGLEQPEFPRVMLARLRPGGIIAEHVDGAPAALWPHKVHVPLATNREATFRVGRTQRHLKAGRVTEVNNNRRHSARNDGDTDRLHLIFECYDAKAE